MVEKWLRSRLVKSSSCLSQGFCKPMHSLQDLSAFGGLWGSGGRVM